MFYAQGDEKGLINTIMQSENIIVKVGEYDERLIGTMYDESNGTFIGYKIKLTADKTQITADGVDTATITATVYTWDDQVAVEFDQAIVFDYEGNTEQPESVVPVDGVASIPFASNEPGDTVFMTKNAGLTIMSNGQISIKAVAV